MGAPHPYMFLRCSLQILQSNIILSTLLYHYQLIFKLGGTHITFLGFLYDSQLAKNEKVDSSHVPAITIYRGEAIGLSISNYN